MKIKPTDHWFKNKGEAIRTAVGLGTLVLQVVIILLNLRILGVI